PPGGPRDGQGSHGRDDRHMAHRDHRPEGFGPRGGDRGPAFGPPGGPRDGRGSDDRHMDRGDHRPDGFGPRSGDREPAFGPGGPRDGRGWRGSGDRPWSVHRPFPFGPPHFMGPPRSPEQVFEELDANKDGVISKDEFLKQQAPFGASGDGRRPEPGRPDAQRERFGFGGLGPFGPSRFRPWPGAAPFGRGLFGPPLVDMIFRH